MHPLKQRPVFAHDVEMRRQLRETRETLLAHLRDKPDDFNALVLAEVVGELDSDPALSVHRAHFRAIRPDDWREQARVRGVSKQVYGSLALDTARRTTAASGASRRCGRAG